MKPIKIDLTYHLEQFNEYTISTSGEADRVMYKDKEYIINYEIISIEAKREQAREKFDRAIDKRERKILTTKVLHTTVFIFLVCMAIFLGIKLLIETLHYLK